MRIIAGELGGRTFEAPNTHLTHPMSERMRGALFNTLGDIEGLTVLDCFGGSGALSLEAASRGAKSSIVVEINKVAHQAIEENIRRLDLADKVKAIRANVSGWSDNNPEAQFDLVLCNPPFDGLKPQLIEKLVKHVKAGGLLVLSWPTRESPPEFAGLDVAEVKEKDYGDAQLVFYRKNS